LRNRDRQTAEEKNNILFIRPDYSTPLKHQAKPSSPIAQQLALFKKNRTTVIHNLGKENNHERKT
jgi:hypothetical protein